MVIKYKEQVEDIDTRVWIFDSVGEFCRSAIRLADASPTPRDNYPVRPKWSGTEEQFIEGCRMGHHDYTKESNKFVDKFSNLAIEAVHREMEYNQHVGVLDYQAAIAGNPECMYGITQIEDDRSPLNIVIDGFTSSGIKTDTIKWRGIAVMSLVRALSAYRPVNVVFCPNFSHAPSGSTAICTIKLPTNPLNVAISAFALCSPTLVRLGMFWHVNAMVEHKSGCSLPPLYQGDSWVANEFGNYISRKVGYSGDTLHLTRLMYGHDGSNFKSESTALAWVTEQIKKFMP